MSTLQRTFVACALLVLSACGAGTRSDSDGGASAGPGGVDPAGPPVVVGTTLDAATGLPVEAELLAPDGTRGNSDAEGHFSLRLQPGTSGPLVAETEDGLIGQVVLRPLQGGRLEVVLHLRRAQAP